VCYQIDVAELLAQQAERETGILSRAFRRAARQRVFVAGRDVRSRVQNRRDELASLLIAKTIQKWIDKPPRRQKAVYEIRQDFLSLAC